MIKRPVETKLQKEFTEKAVNRLRNLVKGKYGEKTITQVGYEHNTSDHIEGDVWEESGKSWTIKNGLKQNITKLDSLKKFIKVPMCCPECGGTMKSNVDKKLYNIHRKCATCVSKIEGLHKLNGTYDEYVKEYVKANMKTDVDSAKEFIKEFLVSSKDVILTEEGDVEENIGDIDKNKMLEQWNKELDQMKEFLSN